MKQNSQMAIFFLIMFLGLSLIINVALILDPGIIKNGYDDLEKDYEKLKGKYDSVVAENKLLENYEKKYKDLYFENLELQEKCDELTKLYSENLFLIEEPSSLSEYSTEILFEDLCVLPNNHKGKAISMSGTIIEIIELENDKCMKIAVDNDYAKEVWVVYKPETSLSNISEQDNVVFYGIYYGTRTFELSLGENVKIPFFGADFIELK